MDLCPTAGDSSDSSWQPSWDGSCSFHVLDYCPTCGHTCLVTRKGMYTAVESTPVSFDPGFQESHCPAACMTTA